MTSAPPAPAPPAALSELIADLALRTSQDLFHVAFTCAPGGMGLLDLQGRYHHVNRAFCQMVGYSEAELLKRTWQELTHASDLLANQQAVAELVSGARAALHLRKRFVHRDGHPVWADVSVVVVRDAAGTPLYNIAQMQDISEQVQAERSLRLLSEAGLRMMTSLDARAAADTLPLLLVPELADQCRVSILGEDGRVAEDVVRTAASAPAQLRLWQVGLCPREPGLVTGAVLRAEATLSLPSFVGGPFEPGRPEGPDPRRSGRGPVLGVPLRARGRTLGAVLLERCPGSGLFQDDEVRLIEELSQRAAAALDNGRLYHEAQQAIGARDRVLRVVAHDLRSPLNAVSLAAGYLQMEMDLPPDQQQELLDNIQRSVRRADRLIGDLLDAAKIAAGVLRVRLVPQAPTPMVSAAAALLQMELSERSLSLGVEVEAGLPPVLADRDRVQQVLGNLLGNAIKFTPAGGRIQVRARRAGGQVCFSVSDEGPGIAAADRPHLFAPFWQAQPEDRRGTGLGLSIARGLVEAQGGQIWVQTGEGQGATFCFTLNVAPISTEAPTSSSAA